MMYCPFYILMDLICKYFMKIFADMLMWNIDLWFSHLFLLLFGFMSRYYWIHKMGWDIIPFTHIFLEGLHRIGIIPSHFSWHSLVNLLSLEYSLWKVFNYKTNFFSGYVASHVFYFFLYHFVK